MKQLNHRLRFRLDWLAARGLKALRENEVRDAQSGVLSAGPLTHTQVNEGQPLSDHHPISADIRLPPEEAMRAGNRAA